MTFAHPSYLWALTALAIPLAIHLLSRKEGKIIRVGSLRHVEESNTSQFKSIRLNEVWLLLLRMLMVSLLVLFMSGAQCSGSLVGNIKWVVAERGVNVDTLIANGYELHHMPENINYWTFAEELNKLPHDIIVVSYSKLGNFKGERIHLNDNIKWITAESVSEKYPALAWVVGDSVFVRMATSNNMLTAYTTVNGLPDSLNVIKPKPVSVSTDNRFVIAALNVLKEEYKLPIEVSNGQTISVSAGIGPLVERISANEIRINKVLDQDVALNENLVIELFKVLYPELQKPEVSKDVRVLPDNFMWTSNTSSSGPQLASPSGIEKYLIVLFILSLAAERFVAIRRNQ